MITEDALEQEDKIEEGINWSDDDEWMSHIRQLTWN
jgi:hypothetical protein